MEGMDVLKVILLLIGFCALLFLTYVTTRYIGGKQNRAMMGKNISIVETVALGMDKRIHLIKAGNQYVLVASTAKCIEFLTTVNLDNPVPEQEVTMQENSNLFDFKALFEKYVSMYKIKKENNSGNPGNATPQDIPESSDFRSNLSRLRTIVQKKEYQVKTNGDDSTNEK